MVSQVTSLASREADRALKVAGHEIEVCANPGASGASRDARGGSYGSLRHGAREA
jgi:hypothetical protein